jgi:carboxyl-terminal processing protease
MNHWALFLLGCLWLQLGGLSKDSPPPKVTAEGASSAASVHAATPDTGVLPSKFTAPKTLAPEESSGEIARLAARMIERSHFLRKEFDDRVSERFFERYLESLDPQRMYFTQADYEEFAAYRHQLDDLTLRRGDTRPAYEIFNRYLQHIDQQYALVQGVLKNGKFSFEGDSRILLNRKEAARPKDLAELQSLWNDRLRFEYLSEKLNRDFATMATNVWTLMTQPPEADTGGTSTNGAPSTATSGPSKTAAAKPSVKPILSGGKKVADLYLADLETRLQAHLSTNRAPVVAKMAEAGKFKGPADLRTYFEANLQGDRHDDIVKTLTRRYNRVMRNLKQFESKEVLQWYLDSLAHSYDPHTNYFGPREEEAFSMSMTLSFVGIGAVLTSEDGYATITEIKPGSPAEKSKTLKAGDKIVAVAQDRQPAVDVIDEKLQKVVEQIRGPKGSKVTLTYIPNGADLSTRKTVTIVRDTIPLEEQEAKAKLVLLPNGQGKTNRIGVIDLPAFYSGAIGGNGATKSPTADVARLLRKLMSEGVDGVVLDLRRNGGGSLEECVSLTGLFIKTGPVVQVVNSLGQQRILEDEDSNVLYDGPLVVLTSRLSASASEILAGALQDYGRAVVVGDSSTHGKGTVQNLQSLEPFYRGTGKPGQVKVTISKFYRPSGSSTQLKGVVPDVVLPSINNFADIGESALSNALPWNTIPPIRFEKTDRVTRALPELQKRSSERVSKDKDYAYIGEDIERYRKQLADRTVSLNEKTRRQEMDSDRDRAAIRKAEIKLRNETEPLTYEITLKNASQPGLPEPKAAKPVVAATARDARALKAGNGKDSAAERRRQREAGQEDGEEEEEGVAADVNLREAERVLIDLLDLSQSRATSSGVTAGVRANR